MLAFVPYRAASTCPPGCYTARDRAGNTYCECDYVTGAMALRGLSGLGGDIPPSDPTIPDPVTTDIQTVKVQAISLWNALLIGVVTGFAVSLGTVAFSRLARRVAGHEVVRTT